MKPIALLICICCVCSTIFRLAGVGVILNAQDVDGPKTIRGMEEQDRFNARPAGDWEVFVGEVCGGGDGRGAVRSDNVRSTGLRT